MQRNSFERAACLCANYAVGTAGAQVCSTQSWAKVLRIADRNQKVSSIPALKDAAHWILEAEGKAKLLRENICIKT